jgi:methionyl-tRNA synthetase
MSHEQLPTETPAVVTVGLPYANGDLHVGHLLGYVSGDLYARALRRIGQQTAFVCGSDMHGTPIAVNAAKEGRDPEQFALEWHEQYEETFPEYSVDFDNYGHTHDATNTDLTREFVQTWLDEGHVIEKEIEVAWDAETDDPLPDRYVEGTCPYCGEKARGDECDEGCQRHLEPGEIEDPVSVITGNPAEYRTREHKFLRLADFQEYLQGFLDRLEGTEKARNQPREWIEGELEDLCITRDMDWGIDYPGDDREDLVLYVWVDAPIEYVSSTRQYSERVGTDEYDWETVWKPGGQRRLGTAWDSDWTDECGEIIHVIGAAPLCLLARDAPWRGLQRTPRGACDGVCGHRRQVALDLAEPRHLGQRVPRHRLSHRPVSLLHHDRVGTRTRRGFLVGPLRRAGQRRTRRDARELLSPGAPVCQP